MFTTKSYQIEVLSFLPRTLHQFLILTADMMCVNGVLFVVTLWRRINLYTMEHIPNCTGPILANSLKKILKVYIRGGYMDNVILMDTTFSENHGWY